MKRIFFGILALAAVACNSKKEDNSFEVHGTIRNSDAKMVYLQESPPGTPPVIIDSGKVEKNGSFTLEGSGTGESLYSLRVEGSPYPFAVLINDVKKISVQADLMNQAVPYTVSGSPASKGIIDYDKASYERAHKIYDLSREIDSLMKTKAPDTAIAVPFGQYEAAAAEFKNFTSTSIEKASSPVLALYILGNFQRLSQQLGVKPFSNTEVSEIVNKASEKFPGNAALAELKRNQRSEQAPEFSLPDTSGTPVALSSFKGKYVLVDFWASWCAPCRQENPNVVKAFNQFRDRNFTVLGVSLDKNRMSWLEAIKRDGLAWTHVSDLKYWQNEAAALYNVRSIPYNVLLDPQGKIIGEDLRGPELISTLEKVLQ